MSISEFLRCNGVKFDEIAERHDFKAGKLNKKLIDGGA
jgi:hypothetical protein